MFEIQEIVKRVPDVGERSHVMVPIGRTRKPQDAVVSFLRTRRLLLQGDVFCDGVFVC